MSLICHRFTQNHYLPSYLYQTRKSFCFSLFILLLTLTRECYILHVVFSHYVSQTFQLSFYSEESVSFYRTSSLLTCSMLPFIDAKCNRCTHFSNCRLTSYLEIFALQPVVKGAVQGAYFRKIGTESEQNHIKQFVLPRHLYALRQN